MVGLRRRAASAKPNHPAPPLWPRPAHPGPCWGGAVECRTPSKATGPSPMGPRAIHPCPMGLRSQTHAERRFYQQSSGALSAERRAAHSPEHVQWSANALTRNVTAVGSDPAQPALVKRESTPLDHSGNLSWST